MATELVHVGFGNVIAINRVIAFLSLDQQPVKRLVRESKEKGLLVDATHGRKAKTAVLFDTGHVLIAAVTAETIIHRHGLGRLISEEEVKP